MKLAKADDVLIKIGAHQHQDTLESADAALEFATPEIENVLGTSLGAGDFIDYFDYAPSRYATASTYLPITLIASHGLWTETPPLVWVSTDGSPLQGVLDAADALDEANYVYNREQGTVKLIAMPYAGLQTIAIQYSSGFEDEDETVPDWLKQAAVAYAAHNLQLFGVGYNKKEMRDKSNTQRAAAFGTLSQKIRTKYGVFASNTVELTV
jgi:hypothetical protein